MRVAVPAIPATTPSGDAGFRRGWDRLAPTASAHGRQSEAGCWAAWSPRSRARSRGRPGRGGGAVLAQARRGGGDAGEGGGAAGGADTAFQQRADRGPIQLGLALVGAPRPAVQPDAVVEWVGLPAPRPEFRADQVALGGGERPGGRGALGVKVRARGTRGIGGGRLAYRGPAALLEGSGGRRRSHRAARDRPGRGRRRQFGQFRVVGRHQPRLEGGAAQVRARPGGMVAKGGHQARAQAKTQAFGRVRDRPARPRPARPAEPGWNAQLPIPVPRRFGVHHARVVARDPPQPQPADEVPAIEGLVVVGGRLEHPRLDRRRPAGRRGRVDRGPHQAVGQHQREFVGEPQLANPVGEIAHHERLGVNGGFSHAQMLEQLSRVADGPRARGLARRASLSPFDPCFRWGSPFALQFPPFQQ